MNYMHGHFLVVDLRDSSAYRLLLKSLTQIEHGNAEDSINSIQITTDDTGKGKSVLITFCA